MARRLAAVEVVCRAGCLLSSGGLTYFIAPPSRCPPSRLAIIMVVGALAGPRRLAVGQRRAAGRAGVGPFPVGGPPDPVLRFVHADDSPELGARPAAPGAGGAPLARRRPARGPDQPASSCRPAASASWAWAARSSSSERTAVQRARRRWGLVIEAAWRPRAAPAPTRGTRRRRTRGFRR